MVGRAKKREIGEEKKRELEIDLMKTAQLQNLRSVIKGKSEMQICIEDNLLAHVFVTRFNYLRRTFRDFRVSNPANRRTCVLFRNVNLEILRLFLEKFGRVNEFSLKVDLMGGMLNPNPKPNIKNVCNYIPVKIGLWQLVPSGRKYKSNLAIQLPSISFPRTFILIQYRPLGR